MSLIETRTFASGADMIAAARNVRNRLWKPHAVNIAPPRMIAAPERIWTRHHQAHVTAWYQNEALKAYQIITGEQALAEGEYIPRIWVESIISEVSRYFKISIDDIKSDRRSRAVVRARQVGMYLCRMLTPRSLPEIGRKFGDRDHTTALWAINKIENLISSGDPIIADIEAISKALKGAA